MYAQQYMNIYIYMYGSCECVQTRVVGGTSNRIDNTSKAITLPETWPEPQNNGTKRHQASKRIRFDY